MRKKILIGLLAATMINSSIGGNVRLTVNAKSVTENTHISSVKQDTEKEYVGGMVLVSIEHGTYKEDMFDCVNPKNVECIDDGKIINEYGIELKSDIPQIYKITLHDNKKQTVLDAVNMLKKLKSVRFAEPNYILDIASDTIIPWQENVPNDELYSEQYGLEQIKAPLAWTKTKGEYVSKDKINPNQKEVLVAILDTGVDLDHPDLKDNLYYNYSESKRIVNPDGTTSYVCDNNGIDDDKDGYIDNFCGINVQTMKLEKVDETDKFNNHAPYDDHGHGTHIAGIIAATENNNIGVVGVAPKVKIVPIKFYGNNVIGTALNAVEAFRYVRAKNIKVVNASWHIQPGDASAGLLLDTIRNCGALVVCAAGNSGANEDIYGTPMLPRTYPACWNKYTNNVISVAGVQEEGKLAGYGSAHWYSNYGGTMVNIGAPGTLIHSTLPTYVTDTMHPEYKDYGLMSGTSMAAPFVAGTAALVLSMHPEYEPEKLRQIILDYSDYTEQMYGKVTSCGILNAAKAVIQPGELTGDGVVDENDLDALQKALNFYGIGTGKENKESEWYNIKADMDMDSDIDQDDYIELEKFINKRKPVDGAGDLNHDGQVTIEDIPYIQAIIDRLGSYVPEADVDRDGDIDNDDCKTVEKIVNFKTLVHPAGQYYNEGDLNNDNKINLLDYQILKKRIERNEEYTSKGDLNWDGDNDKDDLERILYVIEHE